jgi:hypothetical protein
LALSFANFSERVKRSVKNWKISKIWDFISLISTFLHKPWFSVSGGSLSPHLLSSLLLSSPLLPSPPPPPSSSPLSLLGSNLVDVAAQTLHLARQTHFWKKSWFPNLGVAWDTRSIPILGKGESESNEEEGREEKMKAREGRRETGEGEGKGRERERRKG